MVSCIEKVSKTPQVAATRHDLASHYSDTHSYLDLGKIVATRRRLKAVPCLWKHGSLKGRCGTFWWVVLVD